MKPGPTTSIPTAILRWIKRHGPGVIFTATDLAHLGSRAAIDQALSRLTRAGVIRRLGRGIYDHPKVNPLIGPLTPSAEAIAKVIARREGINLKVTGARAANAFGLSTQVPARARFLTEGTPRVRKVAGQTIELSRVTPKRLKGAGTAAGAAVEALRYLGRSGATPKDVQRLVSKLRAEDRREFLELSASAPIWLNRVVREALGSSSAGSRHSKRRRSPKGATHA